MVAEIQGITSEPVVGLIPQFHKKVGYSLTKSGSNEEKVANGVAKNLLLTSCV
jgi:hypothetical protein